MKDEIHSEVWTGVQISGLNLPFFLDRKHIDRRIVFRIKMEPNKCSEYTYHIFIRMFKYIIYIYKYFHIYIYIHMDPMKEVVDPLRVYVVSCNDCNR